MRTVDDTRDEFEEAFREWDDSATISQSAPLAQGSQPYALPISVRTTTQSDPRTTSRLAGTTRRPAVVAQTLEEALLALADGIPELISA